MKKLVFALVFAFWVFPLFALAKEAELDSQGNSTLDWNDHKKEWRKQFFILDGQPPQIPPNAYGKVRKAEVLLRFTITVDGIPKDIIVLKENPLGLGFADNAIASLETYLFKPFEYEGKSTELKNVEYPFMFSVAKTAPITGRGHNGKCVDFLFPDNLKPKKIIQPKFPPKAVYRIKSGYALIGFDISPEGKLENIEIIRAIPNNYGFGKAAKDAAKMMEYEPVFVNGRAIRVECVALKFTFELNKITR